MKKTLLIFTLLFVNLTSFSQVKIGDNPNVVGLSSSLELESTDKALVLTRVANKEVIVHPVNGMIIYDISDNCLKAYLNGSWTGCMTFAPSDESFYPPSTVFCDGLATKIVEVVSPTGRIWMDRNLGASQAAISTDDALSYGSFYQWGRASDGHQCRNSIITNVQSSTDTPNNALFIANVFDWRSSANNELWQSPARINDPCPTGFRLPTIAEFEEERLSWTGGNNAEGAFTSVLKLPAAGYRLTDGLISDVGLTGRYATSTPQNVGNPPNTAARNLYFANNTATASSVLRANGLSVRCIKN
jgi:hypothetical protein